VKRILFFNNNHIFNTGKMSFKSGDCYKGEWKNDKMSGLGMRLKEIKEELAIFF